MGHVQPQSKYTEYATTVDLLVWEAAHVVKQREATRITLQQLSVPSLPARF